MRQAEACHAHEPVHVRAEDALLVVLARLVERRAAEREACVVEEDIEASELLDGRGNEMCAALGVGDVELERDLGLEPLHSACTACDADARCGEGARGGPGRYPTTRRSRSPSCR